MMVPTARAPPRASTREASMSPPRITAQPYWPAGRWALTTVRALPTAQREKSWFRTQANGATGRTIKYLADFAPDRCSTGSGTGVAELPPKRIANQCPRVLAPSALASLPAVPDNTASLAREAVLVFRGWWWTW